MITAKLEDLKKKKKVQQKVVPETTFKVGQIVRSKVIPDVKIQIIETHIQVCYANCVQEWYTGRAFRKIHGVTDVGKLEKFSLIELEAIPEPSKKITDLVKGLNDLRAKKTKFIKSQDFEKASALRTSELTMKDELENLCVTEGIEIKDVLK